MTEEPAGQEPAQPTNDPRPLPSLFLSELQITNFRVIEDAVFRFQPGLNVVIGENNAGKTAVVDALRLLLNLGTFENKEDFIRPRPTDARLHSAANSSTGTVSTTLTATFMGDNTCGTPSQFYELLSSEPTCTFEQAPTISYSTFRLRYKVDFRYNTAKGRFETARAEVRGGDSFENPVPGEALDHLRAIYLAPLRDLVNDRARVGAEIERLILSHTPPEKSVARKEIPDRLRELAGELIHNLTGGRHQTTAGKNLSNYSTPYGIDAANLSFAPAGITDSLLNSMVPLFDHAIAGVEQQLPLSSNGLGINQLIYASIVLSRQGAGLTDEHIHRFFVIEEPEAHLHPQLQDSFFHALNQISDHQIFVTSHSPTITAKTDVDKMIVLHKDRVTAKPLPSHLADAYRDRGADRRYLHKFLDVTRSQLLFARGAIFVEGITEAMLMEQFSDILGRSLRDNAIEVVVVDSSHGFSRFRPLFENASGSLARAAFVTDSDVLPEEVSEDRELLAERGGALDSVRVEADGQTMVAVGYGTFEFGLLRSALSGPGSEFARQLLFDSMFAAAPEEITDTAKRGLFSSEFMDFEQPALAYKKMKQSRSSGLVLPDQWRSTWHTNSHFKAAKSDFSYHLSTLLDAPGNKEKRSSFPVPHYIEAAIKFVTDRG